MATPAAKPPAVSAPTDAPAAVPPPASGSRKFNATWVVVPVVVLLLVGVGVGWETFRARMEEANQGKGGPERLGISGSSGTNGFVKDHKSRELKLGAAGQVVPATPQEPDAEEEDLTGLGVKKRPPAPKPLSSLPPAERAWRLVKTNYDKLEGRNETAARKYRIRIIALEDRKNSTAEANFVKEAGALEEELRVELTKPENQ